MAGKSCAAGSLSSSQLSFPSDIPSSHPTTGNSFTFVLDSNTPRTSRSSQDSLPHIDKFAHTRTKRKRTSAADFAILEAEYSQNPRPDKAARNDLVKRVALSEKEVQIWFQNRRQMTRRKCRTWQPNEISSIIRSSQETTEDVAECSSSQLIDTAEGEEVRESQSVTVKIAEDAKRSQALFGDIEGPNVSSQESTNLASQVITPASRSSKTRHAHAGHSGQTSTPVKSLKGTPSSVRLSMSLDGKAQVVVDSNTPSPPSKSSSGTGVRLGVALRRAQSTTTIESFPDVGEAPQWPQHRAPGRSRDARSWEFYCDRDVRDALTVTAEHEKNGSALGALGLIRCGSASANVLTPSLRKQNSNPTRHDPTKRKGPTRLEKQEPKLARTASSMAKLQTVAGSSRAKSQTKTSSETLVWQDHCGDSDKENWEPGTQSRAQRQRSRSQSRARGRVLKENPTMASHSTSLGVLMERENASSGRGQRRIKSEDLENAPFVFDDDVSAFMAGESAAEGDDLDAVQNLLSLSQGPW